MIPTDIDQFTCILEIYIWPSNKIWRYKNFKKLLICYTSVIKKMIIPKEIYNLLYLISFDYYTIKYLPIISKRVINIRNINEIRISYYDEEWIIERIITRIYFYEEYEKWRKAYNNYLLYCISLE